VSTLDVSRRPAALPTVTIRRAGEHDRPALAQMFARCTPQTRYRRFHGHVNVLPARYLTEALSGSPDHLALVAVVAAGPRESSTEGFMVGFTEGSIAALASCRTDARGVGDLGVLVEDGWQRLGIGAALLREIAGYATSAGIGVFTAQVLAEQSWILRMLTAFGSCESLTTRGVLEVTVTASGRTRRQGPGQSLLARDAPEEVLPATPEALRDLAGRLRQDGGGQVKQQRAV
jgi:GNAT superfamily N-acetyltransferase